MTDQFPAYGRSARLDRVLSDLLGQAPELQAASVVSFDGLPMASALPVGMDEDRVAAMSAALLSLGERAADNFGRGDLNQVYVEGERGTVFLVSADDEAVLVAMGAQGAKVGLLMYEVRRAAIAVAAALRADDATALALAEDQRVAAEAAEVAEQRMAAQAAEQAAVEAALAERRAQLAAEPVAEPVVGRVGQHRGARAGGLLHRWAGRGPGGVRHPRDVGGVRLGQPPGRGRARPGAGAGGRRPGGERRCESRPRCLGHVHPERAGREAGPLGRRGTESLGLTDR